MTVATYRNEVPPRIRSLIDDAIGPVNACYRIATSRNTVMRLRGSRDSILKIMPRAARDGWLRELAALALFADRIPIPQVLTSAEDGDGCYVLLSLLPGLSLSALLEKTGFPEERAFLNAVNTVAKVHQRGQREGNWPLPGFETDVAVRLGLGTCAFMPAWWKQVQSATVAMGTARLSTVREAIEEHVDTLDGIGATCQLVHGDYQPRNILRFDDGPVSGVVDWELSCWAPPLRDIATLIRFCGSDEVEARVIAGCTRDNPFPGDLRRAARCYDLIRISLGISAAPQYSDDLPDWFDYLDGCMEFLSGGNAQRARLAARRLGNL